jgi:putative transposase
MYDYRKMPREDRARILAERKALRRPWHAPPHFGRSRDLYFITAACYEHKPMLAADARRSEWENALKELLGQNAAFGLCGWVVLPNHYHLLIEGDLRTFAARIGRMHNGKATQWNREDVMLGRKVWHRFSDRAIRSERHYYASLNYLHANPVKHGYALSAAEWPWSSFSMYLEEFGRERLAEWWKRYPVGNYGSGWDSL